MRDPSRILIFCDRLAAAWQKVPDWRFGQFMLNILASSQKEPFYMEDEEMIQYIEKFINEIRGER